ncbi:hypothetical protein [Sphingomonas mesophila]|uniref:hypothetical protein n=1 Tax=Sphingomonas mesophila TaxID=2303576 RepID=UPI000E58F018|nr:hypothetical protein [Sphingomonas mesophila]
MAFADLYKAVQELDGRISTRDLKTLAIEHSDIKGVRELWTGLFDPLRLRGCYIEGPGRFMNVDVPPNEALIVISREMVGAKPNGKHWRRLVFTKELMHVFDTPAEKADTEAKFDIQIQRFGDPTLEMSPQFRAESKALYRALMVLCREATRQEYNKQLAAGGATPDYIATALHLPVPYIHYLFQENFPEMTAALLKE